MHAVKIDYTLHKEGMKVSWYNRLHQRKSGLCWVTTNEDLTKRTLMQEKIYAEDTMQASKKIFPPRGIEPRPGA
jgi:hypothetical protein